MDIETREHIHTRVPQVERIKDRSQVNVERIIPLACKDTRAVIQFIDTLLDKSFVIRHGARTHVGGHNNPISGDHCAFIPAHHRHGVGLAQTKSFRTSTFKEVMGGSAT